MDVNALKKQAEVGLSSWHFLFFAAEAGSWLNAVENTDL